MAETESAAKRPFWVTLVAAVATVIVVLALAAGPTLSGCATSAEGFNSCIRQQLADIGLLPRAPLPVEAPAQQDTEVAADDEGAAEPDMQVAAVEEVPAEAAENTEQAVTPQPEADTAGTAAPEMAEPDVTSDPTPRAPLLGLVRVEPDGSLVIAGSAEPGAEIEIYANDQLLGRTTAEASGDWVFVPDQPLEPGAVEITVTAPELGLTADRSVVVVVQEDRTTEPLVVASTPGEASEVLQGVNETPAGESAADTGDNAQEPMQVAEATPPAEPVVDAEGAINAAGADNQSAALANPPAVDTESTAPVEGAVQTGTNEPAASEEAEVASVQPDSTPDVEAAPETPAVAVVPPSIDAIEIDGDRNFFAGGGNEGATIRLYINDGFIADTIVNDGRWLIETARNVLTDVNQRVRVDMLEPGTADVIGRAEVNFEIVLPDIPPSEELATPPVIVADQAADPDAAINAAGAANSSENLSAPPAIGAEPEESIEPDEPLVVADTNSGAESESAPADETTAQPEMADEPMAAETDTGSEPEASAPAPATDTEMAEEVPTITAVQIGEGDEQRFAAGRAIIRRGDNLWTIARRVYGQGVRYTTIYQANREQIRNPDLIYPGQVFSLPGNEE